MEAKYSVNITKFRKIIFLSQHYSAVDCFLYVNGVKIYQFKVSDYKKKSYPLFLGNISKDSTFNHMKKGKCIKWKDPLFFC